MAGFDSKLAVLLSVARFVVQVFLVNRPLGGLLQVQRRALGFICWVEIRLMVGFALELVVLWSLAWFGV